MIREPDEIDLFAILSDAAYDINLTARAALLASRMSGEVDEKARTAAESACDRVLAAIRRYRVAKP